MSVYQPSNPELGKNAIARRVAALRAMNDAGGPQYRRYDKSGARPAYQVEVLSGDMRPLTTREVPAYVLGGADMYPGVRAHLAEALDAALVDPEVSDRESLLEAVLQVLDERCGSHLAKAAAYFTDEGQPLAVAI
ncbi:hypothetical protein ACFPC0_10715 [Streptomyces andamanensis]|uniref:XRE family transcriptional regulator n=1 Tax=Streptomyces andamanensis TaxID=1565035 RepID=A0ABV8TCC3_9ACTN